MNADFEVPSRFCLAALLLLGLASCGGGGSGSATPSPVPTVAPTPTPHPLPLASACFNPVLFQAGSHWELNYEERDATGKLVGSPPENETVSVGNLDGKPALVMTSRSGIETDSRYFALRDGNVIETLADEIFIFGPIPLGSHATYTPAKLDRRWTLASGQADSFGYTAATVSDVAGSPGEPTSLAVSGVISYLGEEKITVPAGTFNTCKFQTITASTTVTEWFTTAGIVAKTTTVDASGTLQRNLVFGAVNGIAIQ
ncbi:hypothetical protein IGB42_03366 [Andreprevotia sp. IGB-42]|uniref:hypothetical protein n=1 Tax=Andreprevotia sp. IGB-42 TaxID=2497473 RepID=UPI0013581517|nr:hypothetical protein [Andreprevotia sp. IGB-42]KAF0812089.1 hypothetical protein IGB42_03366 [Andreprevotia sp. IGB-42]